MLEHWLISHYRLLNANARSAHYNPDYIFLREVRHCLQSHTLILFLGHPSRMALSWYHYPLTHGRLLHDQSQEDLSLSKSRLGQEAKPFRKKLKEMHLFERFRKLLISSSRMYLNPSNLEGHSPPSTPLHQHRSQQSSIPKSTKTSHPTPLSTIFNTKTYHDITSIMSPTTQSRPVRRLYPSPKEDVDAYLAAIRLASSVRNLMDAQKAAVDGQGIAANADSYGRHHPVFPPAPSASLAPVPILNQTTSANLTSNTTKPGFVHPRGSQPSSSRYVITGTYLSPLWATCFSGSSSS